MSGTRKMTVGMEYVCECDCACVPERMHMWLNRRINFPRALYMAWQKTSYIIIVFKKTPIYNITGIFHKKVYLGELLQNCKSKKVDHKDHLLFTGS